MYLREAPSTFHGWPSGELKGGLEGLVGQLQPLVLTTKPLLSAAALTPPLENEAGVVPDDPRCNLT